MHPDYTHTGLLCADERFELLRARRVRTGAPILLRRVRRQPAPPSDLAALRGELALAASLSSAALLLPRWVESAAQALWVMEDPGGDLLSMRLPGKQANGQDGSFPLAQASGALGVVGALALGVQVAELLAELHQRGTVHGGLRPQALLWRAADRRAWLVDFSDASGATARAALPRHASATSARLVYMAPEQTGRVDRGVDARSDLYALGVLLYEALIGAPPFVSDDALELIHWQLAGVARKPAEIDPAIPPPLSDLVMKLLAKTPEERYQSARGVAHDLSACARDWTAHGRIAPFVLARHDPGEQGVEVSRLYGREREVHVLLEAFERTCRGQGSGRMLLVEGYSGIGKTALIQQLYRPIVRQKGYFISGKFDQVVRAVPFGALIQAFRALVRQWLTESEERLAHWRAKLSAALGVNGGVLVEVIPELEFIVGAQPAPAVLGSIEAQNRFQRVLQGFLAALAKPEHPLVLFLDDLQWADAATLGLLEPLLSSPEIRCLMLLGAYRDNELDASPRLSRTLAALDSAGIVLQRVSLGPLLQPDLVQLVADTLRTSAAKAEPLASLIQDKTGGNPFFVIQFLKLLEREGHLRFDPTQACWAYRIGQIADAPLADNVIDLMTRSIRRLPPKAQYTLTMAACIGSRFDRHTLAVVSEQSHEATAGDIAQALAEGLIIDAGTGTAAGMEGVAQFAFLHDRVQQSAYALIPADRRQMVHLTVGRLLHARTAQAQLDADLFDIVHHFNLGRDCIRTVAERREVAALNLAAGRRAKSSTAHDTALELFNAGIGLLDAAAWAEAYELSFELQLELAEGLYLSGDFENALRRLTELADHARSPIDRARVIRLRSVQYENMARYADALQSAAEALTLLGVSLPDSEAAKAEALEREITLIEQWRAGRTIAALVDLPEMSDARIRMVMTMLTDIWSAAYITGDSMRSRLISATMVRLSLQHGNVEESAYGYVTHAITVGPVRGEYADAYEYGRLALAVNRRFADARRRAKIYQQFHAHVNFWCQPFGTCMAYAREACNSGLDSGDFLYAAYGAGTEPWSAMLATQDLAHFVRQYAPSVALIEELKNSGFADSVRLILNWARALQGRTHGLLSLGDATLDEDDFVRRYRDNPFFTGIHAVLRLQICALLGEPGQALQAARHSAAWACRLPGTVWPLMHSFWHALVLAMHLDHASADEREVWLAQLRQAQAGFAELATHCAENFLCQALLLHAEIDRIEGRERDAVEGCERALEFAALHPLLPHQALAHERLGALHLQRGQGHLARLHLTQARALYLQWGATAKAEALSHQIGATGPSRAVPAAVPGAEPAPIMAPSRAEPEASWRPGVDGLDLFSVLKATQAIAGEFDLANLPRRLLHIAMENAGAERSALVLESLDGPLVYASATDAQDRFADEAERQAGPIRQIEHGVPLEHSKCVPAGIVNLVRRTAETVVLGQADGDDPHASDAYVAQYRPRSLVCLPVRLQGRPIGTMVLEHRRVGGVFTPPRLDTLRILATQVAISVENARLVDGLIQEIAERKAAQDGLATALSDVERLKDNLEAENSYLRRDMIANVSHDLRTPLVSMRGYLELLVAKGEALEPDKRGQYLDIAVRQCERLSRLVDELFELAKLDLRGMTLNREAIQLGELAADVVQKFRLAAEGRQIGLQADAPSGLPFVDVDVGLLERVFENLIGNALRHTPPLGQVHVGVTAEADHVMARVADSGSGIAVDDLPFIFDRLYRGKSGQAGGTEGAGLGLAITRRILELHGAEIRVQSEVGVGTCFSFELPVRLPTIATAPNPAPESSAV